jgi:hypothetical protein
MLLTTTLAVSGIAGLFVFPPFAWLLCAITLAATTAIARSFGATSRVFVCG